MSRKEASRLRGLLVLALTTALAGPALDGRASAADAYPSQPIRLVVPFSTGGTVDAIARVIAAELSNIAKTPVLVENRGGAGGLIGTDYVARAPGDGYTLLLHSAAIAYDPSLYDDLPYDTARDLAPISRVGSTPNVLVVNASLAVHSVRELIDLAKAKPGTVTYASGGVGSSSDLAFALFRTMSSTSFNAIPFKGAGPALIDVVGGHVDAMIATLPGALPQVQAGRVRALGISSARRSPAMPDIPTIAESGLPGYEYTAWFGIFAPGSTPPELQTRIDALVEEAVDAPETRAKFAAFGVEPQTDSPADFRTYLGSEITKWHTVIQQAGIKPPS